MSKRGVENTMLQHLIIIKYQQRLIEYKCQKIRVAIKPVYFENVIVYIRVLQFAPLF